jgi:hypothetical protein
MHNAMAANIATIATIKAMADKIAMLTIALFIVLSLSRRLSAYFRVFDCVIIYLCVIPKTALKTAVFALYSLK